MNICLHAGMHKTGTKSLQNAITAHEATFAEAGVIAHVNPPQILANVPECFDPAWISRQVEFAERAGYCTLLFSAEAISLFSKEQMRELVASFDGRRVRVVLVLRHWSGYWPSRWKQNCTRRDTQSFPAFLSALHSLVPDHLDCNYARLLENMRAGARTDLRVISYDNAHTSGHLQCHLLEALGLPAQSAMAIAAQVPILHQSVDNDFYELCRLFNGAWSAYTGREADALFKGIREQRPIRDFNDFFYDFGRCVNRLRNAGVDVVSTLLGLIAESRRTVSIPPGLAEAWYAHAQAALPYLQNPRDGCLFRYADSPSYRFSDLEIGDLPASLRQRMVACIAEQASR